MEDAALLAKWNKQLIADEGDRDQQTLPELRERMRDWLARQFRGVIFSVEAVPAGYALFRIDPDEIYLRQFFISAEFRRRGIGTLAIEILRANCWPTNLRMTVDVLCANRTALSFWRSLGYAEYLITLERLPPSSGQGGRRKT